MLKSVYYVPFKGMVSLSDGNGINPKEKGTCNEESGRGRIATRSPEVVLLAEKQAPGYASEIECAAGLLFHGVRRKKKKKHV